MPLAAEITEVDELPQSPPTRDETFDKAREIAGETLTKRGSDAPQSIDTADVLAFAQRQVKERNPRVDSAAVDKLKAELEGDGVPMLEEGAEPQERLQKTEPLVPERPAQAETTAPAADGVPSDPMEVYQKLEQDYPRWVENRHNFLHQRYNELSAAMEQLEALKVFDPVSGRRMEAQLMNAAAEFERDAKEFEKGQADAQTVALQATTKAIWGDHEPSQQEVDEVCDFCVDRLGMSPNLVMQIALIPPIAAAIGDLYASSKVSVPGRKSRAQSKSRPQQRSSSIEQALRRLEKHAAKHGRVMRGT